MLVIAKMSDQKLNNNQGDSLDSNQDVKPIKCQGSMGLHQNNFKRKNISFDQSSNSHENTIVEVFRKFRDRCILKFRDGIAQNSAFRIKFRGKMLRVTTV